MARSEETKRMTQIFLSLILLVMLVSIYVWRTEEMTFDQSTATNSHLPSVHLIPPSLDTNTAEPDTLDASQRRQTQSQPNPKRLRRRSDQSMLEFAAINRARAQQRHEELEAEINPNHQEFGIDTAPYDLSKLYIYGEDTYCNNPAYTLKYMDITGMYDTGTNAFYQLLTKNCFGTETRPLDYIVDFAEEGASESEKRAIRAKADEYYASERPKVLQKTATFRNVKWKPLTGKHHVIAAVQDFTDPEWADVIQDIRERLSLVIIKDPLTWFKSLCKAPYEVHWYSKKYRTSHCPFGLSRENGKFSANMWHSVKFASVVELWNFWYGSWTDSGITISGNWKPTFSYWDYMVSEYDGDWRSWMKDNFVNTDQKYLLHDVNTSRFNQELYYKSAEDIPHLVIRYEDILFQPERLIQRLCDCVGGYVREGGPIIMERTAKGHGEARGRKQALQTYGNPQYRVHGYSEQDVQFMKQTLNETLLKLFSYEL